MMTFKKRQIVLVPLVMLLSAACGCREVSVLPADSLSDLTATATSEGVAVSFVLRDTLGHPAMMLFGTGVIRIEDVPESSVQPRAGAVDTTHLLYNRQLIISREYFETEGDEDDETRPPQYVCRLGVFPYRHFLKRPASGAAIVRVAVVNPNGPRLMTAEQRVEWPREVLERPDCFGTVVPFPGGG